MKKVWYKLNMEKICSYCGWSIRQWEENYKKKGSDRRKPCPFCNYPKMFHWLKGWYPPYYFGIGRNAKPTKEVKELNQKDLEWAKRLERGFRILNTEESFW